MRRGYFITLEGPDGVGKTTQLALLLDAVKKLGLQAIQTREPGGTAIGDAVREILLNPNYSGMTTITEALLYAASRAQLVQEVIKPALLAGKVVLCDRFIDSSLAYQVYAGGLDFDFVWQINRAASADSLPDRTFVLNLDPQVGLARRGKAFADRMEQKPLSYHRRVRDGFLKIAERFPERIVVIDANQPVERVFAEIWSHLAPVLVALR
ncbi:MAG: dTMP kinase [Firmicutes bacterium]|nr:dTMP kinase [Bacillota bacterium]